jgi:hypothetical protein
MNSADMSHIGLIHKNVIYFIYVSADYLLLHIINKSATSQSRIFNCPECEKADGQSRESRKVKTGYNFMSPFIYITHANVRYPSM